MKYVWPKLAAAGLLIGITGAALAVTPGDVNGDNKVNVADATLTLQIAVGLVTPTADEILAADVSPVDENGTYGDRKVAVGDAVRLLQRAVGLIPDNQFPGLRSINETVPGGSTPLAKTQTVTVAGNQTVDFQLPGGFRLQGNVTGTKSPDVTAEEIVVLDSKGQTVVSSPVSGSGQYLVGVPAGTFQLYYAPTLLTGSDLPPGIPGGGGPGTGGGGPGSGLNRSGGARPLQFPGLGATTRLLIPTGVVVSVGGDTTKDITRPALPALFTVSGKINAILAGGTPPFNVLIRQIKDASGNDNIYETPATATFFAIDTNYSVSLPAGTYAANVLLPGNDGAAVTLESEFTIPVTGVTQADITLPSLVTLSGTASLNGSPFGSVNPSVFTAGSAQNTSLDSSLSPVANGQYALRVTPGTYDVTLNFEESGNGTGLGNFNFVVKGIEVPADKTENLQASALPTDRSTIQGKVTGSNGAPVTQGDISFTSRSLTGALPQLGFSISKAIGLDGTYSVTLPSGEYSVLIDPNPGFPVAEPDLTQPAG